ncbi:MAG TPA: hypothetical protein VLL97_08180 [Acidobacteriota bacterium]|nr:hypothetical protein [Acidobacteriota bacterium]
MKNSHGRYGRKYSIETVTAEAGIAPDDGDKTCKTYTKEILESMPPDTIQIVKYPAEKPAEAPGSMKTENECR